MDDMRERYRLPRRDYAAPRRPVQPTQRPVAPSEPPKPVEAAPPQPAPHYQAPPRHQPSGSPEYAPAPYQPKTEHRTKKSRRGRRFLKLVLVLIILGVLAGGGFKAYQKYHVTNPFSPDIRQSAGVDLLYPTKLPAGYAVDNQSINLSQGILIYDAKQASGSNRIVFTIQKTPATFDFTTFYKQQLTDSRQVSTPYGTATIGRNSGRALGSLVDDQTWLLLSTNTTQISQDNLSLIMSNLKLY